MILNLFIRESRTLTNRFQIGLEVGGDGGEMTFNLIKI